MMKSATPLSSARLSVAVSVAIVAGAIATALAATAKKDVDQYVIEIKPPVSCAVGKECKAEISIKSKGEFHINDKYPTKFTAQNPPPQGVTFTKALLKREDGRSTEKEFALPIGFKASKAGRFSVGGVFAFSVASDANVLMEKVDLAVAVDVK